MLYITRFIYLSDYRHIGTHFHVEMSAVMIDVMLVALKARKWCTYIHTSVIYKELEICINILLQNVCIRNVEYGGPQKPVRKYQNIFLEQSWCL